MFRDDDGEAQTFGGGGGSLELSSLFSNAPAETGPSAAPAMSPYSYADSPSPSAHRPMYERPSREASPRQQPQQQWGASTRDPTPGRRGGRTPGDGGTMIQLAIAATDAPDADQAERTAAHGAGRASPTPDPTTGRWGGRMPGDGGTMIALAMQGVPEDGRGSGGSAGAAVVGASDGDDRGTPKLRGTRTGDDGDTMIMKQFGEGEQSQEQEKEQEQGQLEQEQSKRRGASSGGGGGTMIMEQFGEAFDGAGSAGTAGTAAIAGTAAAATTTDVEQEQEQEQEQPKRRGARTSGDRDTIIMKPLGDALQKLPSFMGGKAKSWAEDDGGDGGDRDVDDGVTAAHRDTRRSGDGATMIQKLAQTYEHGAAAAPGTGAAADTAEEGPRTEKRDKKDKKDKKRKKDKG